MQTFIAGEDDAGRRIDRVVRKFLPGLPLSAVYSSLRKKRILLNGIKTSASVRVNTGDHIQISDSLLSERRDDAIAASSPGTSLAIIFENDHLLAVNKPPGIPTHGNDSLTGQVLSYLSPDRQESLSFQPGPLHRLDKGTSGLIFFGKTLHGSRSFSASIQSGHTQKYYIALLDGLIHDNTRWKTPVSGKNASSIVFPLCLEDNHTLACIRIFTGRKHQIRIQAAEAGNPLSGDRYYGGSPLSDGFILHAYALSVTSDNPSQDFPDSRAILPASTRRRLEQFFGSSSVHDALEDTEKIISQSRKDIFFDT